MKDTNDLLALWIRNRLGEREAIVWATRALRRVSNSVDRRMSFGQEIVQLLDRLAKEAARDNSLADSLKFLWKMLSIAANERQGPEQWWLVEKYRATIRSGQFRSEDIDELVEFVRPRLSAREPMRFDREAETKPIHDPMTWVIWDFETACSTLSHGAAKLDRKLLGRLSVETLNLLLNEATTRLGRALELAREVGWLESHESWRTIVEHVAVSPNATDDDGATDDTDPDAYNDDFAPLVRLTTAAFDALSRQDAVKASQAANRWIDRPEDLFLRLAAYAAWNPAVRSGDEAAHLLMETDHTAFWNRSKFPEIASLRALRWSNLSHKAKMISAKRLLAGPPTEAFPEDTLSIEDKTYARDLELARITDNGADVPREIVRVVATRRKQDPDFPRHVDAIEYRESFQVGETAEGDAGAFLNVPEIELIDRLADAKRTRSDFLSDDVGAFARRHKERILRALELPRKFDENAKIVWSLLLSWPHERSDDRDIDQRIIEGIAKRALALPDKSLADLADRLCYWLDAADSQHADFFRGKELWTKLLPFAVAIENGRIEEQETINQINGDKKVTDISDEALNGPLGHLFSYFLRRCPSSMPAIGGRPPLPADFAEPLKKLTGRARAIVANRIVVLANYFILADQSWFTEIVIEPMQSDCAEGRELWEAFARYSPFPRPALWEILQKHLTRQLAVGRLSGETQRRLAQIAVVAWNATKESESQYVVDIVGLRRALTICTDDVRAAAAWQFASLFRSAQSEDLGKDDGDSGSWRRFGKSFFDEVWPMEPALQSGKTANDFARIPAYTGPGSFAEAVETVLPYLRPFELWDVESGLAFGKAAERIVRRSPDHALALINACVADDWGTVYRLDGVLRLIVEERPNLDQDPRMRRLRRHLGGP